MAEEKLNANAISSTEITLQKGERVVCQRSGNDNAVGVFVNDQLAVLSVYGFADNGLPSGQDVDITDRFDQTGKENTAAIFALDWGVSANAKMEISFGSNPKVSKTVSLSGPTKNHSADVEMFQVKWE